MNTHHWQGDLIIKAVTRRQQAAFLVFYCPTNLDYTVTAVNVSNCAHDRTMQAIQHLIFCTDTIKVCTIFIFWVVLNRDDGIDDGNISKNRPWLSNVYKIFNWDFDFLQTSTSTNECAQMYFHFDCMNEEMKHGVSSFFRLGRKRLVKENLTASRLASQSKLTQNLETQRLPLRTGLSYQMLLLG